MGVMSCFRKGCTNVMCDRYSSRFGYICDECFEELMHSNKKIEKFMKTHKGDETAKRHTEESLENEFVRIY